VDSLDALLVVLINNPLVIITSRISKNKYFTISLFIYRPVPLHLKEVRGLRRLWHVEKECFNYYYFCAFLTIKSEACAGFLKDSTVLAEMAVLSGTVFERKHLKGK